MSFYRISQNDSGMTTIEIADRISGPGYTLNGTVAADRSKTNGGWQWFDTMALFAASSMAQGAQAGITRTKLIEAGVDPSVLVTQRPDGQPWSQPTGATDAYAKGAAVTYGGKTWTSVLPANVWAPGVAGWRADSTSGGAKPWTQPTGATDAYAKGALVTYRGATWVSTADANVWAPGVYGWTKQ